MQRKDLALRVLSTATIMSIVTSIAAPAFANVYYIGNGSIDVKTITKDGKQYVEVKQGTTTYQDESDEIVIKDGTDENNTTLKDAARAAATPAADPAATPATQEPEAAGLEDAAGESQPDPDDAFTLNETGEDSAQTQEGKDNTKEEDTPDPSTEPPKKDVVYEYAPADPNPEQPATKLAPTSAAPAAKTKEATLDDAPAATPPAEGSAKNPTQNVIRVINNWAKGVLNIRLSNVNIKSDDTSRYADGKTDVLYDSFHGVSAAEVQGTGNTQIELDGQNVLDSSACQYWAGLSKKGSGNLTITDKTSDKGETITAKKEADTSGSLRAEAGHYYGAAIGGSCGQATDNITIEGYATVKANTLGNDGAGIGGGGGAKGSNITIQGHANVTANGGLSGAGIGGGARGRDSRGRDCGGDAENITIQDYAKVTATGTHGAAIGSGSAWATKGKNGDAKNIVIRGHAIVNAKNGGEGAAIGAAGYGNDASAEVTIGTKDATDEDVRITATGVEGSAIGNGAKDTKVTIQGHVTIQTASSDNYVAIGSENGNVDVTIKDNVAIDTDPAVNIYDEGGSGIGGGWNIYSDSGRTVVVTIDGEKDGKVKLGEKSALTGYYGAISATTVNIRNNVLLKMKRVGVDYSKYINVKAAEAEVGTRSDDPTASGLVNSIGDNTELWYLDGNKLQKIVHSKNLCKKKQVGETAATCTTPGSKTYECTFEKDKDAVDPEHTEQWTENTDIDPNAHNYVKTSTVPPTCGAQGYDEYTCTHDPRHTYKTNYTSPTGLHTYGEWTPDTATCTAGGTQSRTCSVCNHVDTKETPALGHHWVDSGSDSTHTCDRDHVTVAHSYGDWDVVTPATCTTAGKKKHTCSVCGHVETQEIPATGHHWKDNGDGTHTCTKCGATEGQPFNTNSALELRVVDAEGMDQPFTVSQNGTLRTYTGAYDVATLTGDLDTLRYLQDHGAQTIQFVTNGQTSSFAINDLLAQGSGSEVFYLTHRGAEEPTLLLVEADHSELVKD
ncbi:hypothetical protein [Faecalibacterium prausnitzii]|uniref:hypothetical protein n=1 Tax=Faecalibacterium prausnitzii TaxID=853 RepID=UPI002913D03D|nr:hypothetical protein [Faecalibacterium prausnitzii]MDU8668393.1 hypothetical protein [Faecalibacterium prausnitzii]